MSFTHTLFTWPLGFVAAAWVHGPHPPPSTEACIPSRAVPLAEENRLGQDQAPLSEAGHVPGQASEGVRGPRLALTWGTGPQGSPAGWAVALSVQSPFLLSCTEVGGLPNLPHTHLISEPVPPNHLGSLTYATGPTEEPSPG